MLVTPEQDPLDMKASIQHGIEYLKIVLQARASDGVSSLQLIFQG